jgi:putative ABC transport system permease protein
VLDARVLLFAALLTTITGILFGVVPAARTWRGAGADALREGPRAAVSGRERLRSLLVVAQISASIVLLVCAGLMMRALVRVQGIDPGFSPDNVLTMRTALPGAKYRTTAAKTQFYDRIRTEVSALPGVTSAAYTSGVPMVMRGGIWEVEVKDGSGVRDLESAATSFRIVTPGFFRTLGIPMRAGRDVTESDTFDSRFVAVVSESFARTHWPRGDAMGRTFKLAFFERTVVGIVRDIRVRGLERISEPQVYVPYKQFPDGGVPLYAPKDLVIKTAAEPSSLINAVRGILRNADPELPISEIRTMNDILALETGSRRTQISVLGLFAAAALLLAAVGIHGLLSFAVSQRRQEIGVRMALGARPADVLRMVTRESLVLAVIGCVTGMLLGLLAGRAFDALLAGIPAADLPTFAVVAVVAVLMTLSGTLIPALTAVKVDPATALRNN